MNVSLFQNFLFIFLFILCAAQLGRAQVEDSPLLPAYLEVQINTPNEDIGPLKKIPIIVTINNSGDEAAENVVVRIGPCTCKPSILQEDNNTIWNIPQIKPSASDTLIIDYFTMTDKPAWLFAFVESMESTGNVIVPDLSMSNISCERPQHNADTLIINPDITPFICKGDVTLTTQRAVNDFAATCVDKRYNGSITINGFDISSLDTLAELDYIDGDLTIIRTKVTSLDQLLKDNFSISGNVFFRGNHSLKEINLGPLLDFSGAIKIRYNTNLERIVLPLRSNSIKDLKIRSNFELETINVNGIQTIEENLYLSANRKLKDLNSFSSLTSVGGKIEIALNTSLKSLKGLENLTSVNAAGIGDAEKPGLYVWMNYYLSECCAIFDLLNNDTVIKDGYEFSNNATGCNGDIQECRTSN